MSKSAVSSHTWQQQQQQQVIQQRSSSSQSYDLIPAAILGKASRPYSNAHSHGAKHGGKLDGKNTLKLPLPSHRGKSTKKKNNINKSSSSSNADDDFDGFSDGGEDDDDDDPSYGPGGRPIIHKPSNGINNRRNPSSSFMTKIKYTNNNNNNNNSSSSSSKPARGGSKGKSMTKGKGKTKIKVNLQRQQQTAIVAKVTKSIPCAAAALNDDDDDDDIINNNNNNDDDSSSISSVESMDTPSEISDDSDNYIERSLENTHLHNGDEDEDEDDNDEDDEDDDIIIDDNDNDDDDDDDDVYQAVDDVSDGADELDTNVEQLEEQVIIQTENFNLPSSHLSDFSSTKDSQEYVQSPTGRNGLSFADQTGTHAGNSESLASDRHVHFQSGHNQQKASTDSSSSSSSFSDSDMYSDDDLMSDFLQQDALDPDLRKIIESDADSLYNQRHPEFVVTHDYYDFPGNIYHTESDSSYQSDSSDYDIESDGGETTDEDYPPPATITHPRSLLRRDSSASLSASHDENSNNASSRPFRRRGPLRGTFVADPHKPVALVAPNGTSLILIPPYASSRHDWLETAAANSLVGSTVNTALNSPTTMPSASVTKLFDFDSDTDAAIAAAAAAADGGAGGANGMVANGGGCGDGNGESNGQTTANHPASFFQYNGVDCLDIDEDMEDCEDDSEALLNVDDFIDFGESSSDEGEEEEEEEDEYVARSTHNYERSEVKEDFYDSDAFATPSAPNGSNNHVKTSDATPSRRPSKDNSSSSINNNNNKNEVILDAERLLNRLDGGVVTAFRQNHNRYHALIRLPPHKEFLPANSPSRSASNVSSVFRRTKFSERPSRQKRRYVPLSLSSSAAAAAAKGASGAIVAGGYSTPVTDRKRTASSLGYSGSEAVRRKLLDSSRRGSAVLNSSIPSTPATPAPSVTIGSAH
ncbi:hypothetical protein KEM54_002199 [Ascosphaera aggregata]|nr:hypothetical protein KEM54_002199 [Ascosphaera aggregata]